jgi:hypothetical protein
VTINNKRPALESNIKGQKTMEKNEYNRPINDAPNDSENNISQNHRK